MDNLDEPDFILVRELIPFILSMILSKITFYSTMNCFNKKIKQDVNTRLGLKL